MSETQAPRPHWARLGRELRRLREFAGLTQRDIAGALRVSQATVDRTERGGPRGRPPSWPAVRQWAGLCAEAQPDLGALREMTALALDEHTLYRNLMSEGLASVQEGIHTGEATARLLRNFNPWGVPGLLQTEGYARHVLAITDYQQAGGIDAAVKARLRRQEVLHDRAHRFEFVVTAEGLRKQLAPVPVLAAQLDYLAEVAALPSVSFSVVPDGAQLHAWPAFGFVIYENHADGQEPWVAVELYHKRIEISEPAEVEVYRAQYELLRQPAVSGNEAVALVRAARERLRQGGSPTGQA